jgi:hypothetical protein
VPEERRADQAVRLIVVTGVASAAWLQEISVDSHVDPALRRS